jgi:hypothetical protein
MTKKFLKYKRQKSKITDPVIGIFLLSYNDRTIELMKRKIIQSLS